jgi:hypothetical protein
LGLMPQLIQYRAAMAYPEQDFYDLGALGC